jgi:hypothetical protein
VRERRKIPLILIASLLLSMHGDCPDGLLASSSPAGHIPTGAKRTAQLFPARKWQHQMEPPTPHVRTTDTSPETRAEYTTA